MRSLIPYLPFYLPMLGVLTYMVRHEKEHTKIWLLVKQLCTKAHIDDGR
jgi:hypothetical protein